MSVTLRERKKGKKISLYLDIYNDGKRVYEYLKMYLFPQPEKGRLTNEQKDHNEKTLAVANKIATDRQWQQFNGEHDIIDKSRIKGSFILYMEHLAQKREDVKGNHGNWLSTIRQLRIFDQNVLFADINKRWLENWKEFLDKKAKKSNGKLLMQNTKSSYYSKVIAAIKEAVKDGIIKSNPAESVKPLASEESEKEFLTVEEINLLINTECENPVMKKAFLFSCLTGLRWSDVTKLKWKDIQHSIEIGYFVRFRQQKTSDAGTIPITNDAIEIIGEFGPGDEKIFRDLKYSSWNNTLLQLWVMKAGISKKISFHCSRHTFATLLLTKGSDLPVVQSLLLHKSIKNTQIYAKIINSSKKEAVEKLKFNMTGINK
jgi:site-specific recombinase XerD